MYTKIEDNLKIFIEQIKIVTRYTFLVIVNKSADQKWLMDPFLKMGNYMVLAMPWIAKFNANAMRIIKAHVWIDLPMLNPVFEYYANQLLAKVGTMIYMQTTKNMSRFLHI